MIDRHAAFGYQDRCLEERIRGRSWLYLLKISQGCALATSRGSGTVDGQGKVGVGGYSWCFEVGWWICPPGKLGGVHCCEQSQLCSLSFAIAFHFDCGCLSLIEIGKNNGHDTQMTE